MSELQDQSIFMGFTVSHQNSTDNNLFLSLSQYAGQQVAIHSLYVTGPMML